MAPDSSRPTLVFIYSTQRKHIPTHEVQWLLLCRFRINKWLPPPKNAFLETDSCARTITCPSAKMEISLISTRELGHKNCHSLLACIFRKPLGEGGGAWAGQNPLHRGHLLNRHTRITYRALFFFLLRSRQMAFGPLYVTHLRKHVL